MDTLLDCVFAALSSPVTGSVRVPSEKLDP
jgi:hypothetical protein